MERISLSNATFEGGNNVYLFTDGPETVLIDTGDWTESTNTQLQAGLAERGVRFGDIDRILLTHWHPDHTGLTGEIQDESGADVYIHQKDAPLVAGDEREWDQLHDIQKQYYDEWRIPNSKQSELWSVLDGNRIGGVDEVSPLGPGDIFAVNDGELRVVHAPGHTRGQCLFEWTHDGNTEILSGDALLPKYTPNVGGADVRVDEPLKKYLRTLQEIATAEYDRAWPGHRDPISDPTSRAKHIVHHHQERAWRILDTLDRYGPCDVWTVSDVLFGELQGIHILHGPGESYAHLEHLTRDGTVVTEGTEYRVTDETAEAMASREDRRWPLSV